MSESVGGRRFERRAHHVPAVPVAAARRRSPRMVLGIGTGHWHAIPRAVRAPPLPKLHWKRRRIPGTNGVYSRDPIISRRDQRGDPRQLLVRDAKRHPFKDGLVKAWSDYLYEVVSLRRVHPQANAPLGYHDGGPPTPKWRGRCGRVALLDEWRVPRTRQTPGHKG